MALIVTDALKFRESENDQFRRLSLSANFNAPVPISQGGTGADNAADARANLAVPNMQTDTFPTLLPPDGSGNWIKIGKANSSYGLLPSQEGGGYGSGYNYLGASTWYWKGAYVDNYYGGWAGATIPIDKGGTGATTAAAARTNLGVPYISTIRQKITVPYTAESDGIVEINIRLDTTGRGYAIYSGSFEGFIDGYTVGQGYITGTRPVKKGSVIDAPSSQLNIRSIDYYWTSFSN